MEKEEKSFYRDRIFEKVGFKEETNLVPDKNPPKEIQASGFVSPTREALRLEREHRRLALEKKNAEKNTPS